MHVDATWTFVCQAVNHPWVRMEVEDNRFIVSEDCFVFAVCEAVGVIFARDELEEVDHVDEADFERGKEFAEKSGSGKSLVCRDITAGCHNYVGFSIGVGRGPFPDSDTFGAVFNGSGHIKVLKMVLLVSNNDVDIIDAAEAVIGDGKETISIGG